MPVPTVDARFYLSGNAGERLAGKNYRGNFGNSECWTKILKGERPSLSIEITRECPLQCPGCYAYNNAHLGSGVTLRSLNDRKGQPLIDGVLELVDRVRPLHLSIVGGDPLVRYRELEEMIPRLLARGIHVQVVTSAFRSLASGWAAMPRQHRGFHRRIAAGARFAARARNLRAHPSEHRRIRMSPFTAP